jgi:hypothetical protein
VTVTNGPRTIFLIRHGEKGVHPPPHGVTLEGQHDRHSLTPRGWQRAGALALLFAPQVGSLRPGILTPDELFAPDYSKEPEDKRTYQTIEPLGELIGQTTQQPYAVGEEEDLGALLSTSTSGVTLVCWEHNHLPAIVQAITPSKGELPTGWPDDRFDMIWAMTRGTDGVFEWSQAAQLLLDGDRPV